MRTALFLALTLTLASCVSSQLATVATPPATALSSAVCLDSLTSLPAYLVPAPAGSTPRQRRQWQKAQTANLARAGVLPVKLKNSSLASAPGAIAVSRSTAPVAIGAGAVSTDARKAGQRGGGGVAAGIDSQATGAVMSKASLPWWLLLGLGCVVAGWRLAQAKKGLF